MKMSALPTWRRELEKLNRTYPKSQMPQRAELRNEGSSLSRDENKSVAQEVLAITMFLVDSGKLFSRHKQQQEHRNMTAIENSTPPHPLRQLSLPVAVAGPFASLGFGSPQLPNDKVGQRPSKRPTHLQMPSKGFRTLPRGLPIPSVLQPQGWLVTAVGQVSQLWPRSTREQGGGFGKCLWTG